jgi:hypothetical protein
MLDDGTLWIGRETWPDAGLGPDAFQVLEESAEERSMLVSVDRPCLDPGTTFEGRRVSYVQDDVPHVGGVTMRVWFEDEQAADMGRFRESLAALVRATPYAFDYRARYWARVITQSGSTIHIQPEDPSVPDMGAVMLVGPAGMSQDSVVGGRVLVGWAGNPARAYAEAFDGGETVGQRTISGGTVIINPTVAAYLGGQSGAELAMKGTSTLAYLIQVAAAINALAPGSVPPPTPALIALKAWVA